MDKPKIIVSPKMARQFVESLKTTGGPGLSGSLGSVFGAPVVVSGSLPKWVSGVLVEPDGNMVQLVDVNEAYMDHVAEGFRKKGWRMSKDQRKRARGR